VAIEAAGPALAMITLFPSRTVFLDFFDWEIHWYGLLYIVAFWLVWVLLPQLQRHRGRQLSRDQWTYVLAWAVAGVLIGGRLGYVLFYEPTFYFNNPLEIVAIWNGGMSSHGGMSGAVIAIWYVSRTLSVNWLTVLDIAAVPAAIGLALGRLGNLINQELYGDNPIAIIKNVIIAGAVYLYIRRRSKAPPGQAAALFLVLYGVLRFYTEYWREPEWPLVFGLTRGQLLTVPVLVAGVWLWHRANRLNS
jgi:phosphatidylglycerol---prolipoprotein diacylglyceryl transferase